MKSLGKYIVLAFVAFGIAASATAQESSSSSVVRRRSTDDRKKQQQQDGTQITQRMQAFYEEQPTSEADLSWMRVIYRELDLNEVKNAPLYFPEEPTEDGENLFRIIMRLLASNSIPAYEYLDGREVFTDAYRIKVKDMLDRFHVLYTEAKGSTEKNPKFTIEESDVPCNEVLSYYILERWQMDSRSNRMHTIVEAICPVLHRSGDFGGEPIKYPMFWVKFDALRPYLTQQNIFIDDDNNLAKYTYDDFFQLAMYDGEIYKTRNLRNKSMMQLYPDPDDRKRAQDSIQNRLTTFEDKMWVPSREEIIAAREAREEAEALAAGDSTSIASRYDKASEKKRSARSTKRAKKQKEKKAKVESSNNDAPKSAVRSVRRRK